MFPIRKKSARPQRVAVVTNKNAGRGTSRAGLGTVIGSILSGPYRHYDTATLGELDSAIRTIAKERPDIFAFSGGDGSVHQTLTRLIREYDALKIPLPQLLYAPAGTMNNIAASLNLTRLPAPDLARKIREKIEAQNRGEERPFDIAHANPIKVNDEYGFIYGSGIPVNFLTEYYKAPHRCENGDCGALVSWASANRTKFVCAKCGKRLVRGTLGPGRALQVIFSALWEEVRSRFLFRKPRNPLMVPVHARIALPEGSDPPVAPSMRHTGILVASVDQIGMGCRGMPDAMVRQHHFMLRSTQLSFWGLANPATLGGLFAGMGLPSTFDRVVDRLVIEYEAPTVTTIDGEMKPARDRDVITSGPLLKFITG